VLVGERQADDLEPLFSIHLSARAAASNCSSLHKPWRSTKLRAVLSCDDDTGPPNR